MKMNETKQIGKRKYNFQFEGTNLFEVLLEAQKLSFGDVPKCGVCGKDNLVLNARNSVSKTDKKTYKYTEIKCLDCSASLTFGRTQDDPDTFYLRRNEKKELDWKAYEAE